MSATAVQIPPQSDYGAVEIKKSISKYTIRAFIITMSVIVLFFLYNFIMNTLSELKGPPKIAPLLRTDLIDLAPPVEEEQQQQELTPPPPAETIMNAGPASRAGTPVAVEDAEISADMQDFATIDEISRASAEGGSGVDLGGFSENIDYSDKPVNVQQRESEPDPDEFIPVEKEAGFDFAALQKLVVYPKSALESELEGQVIVKCLIGKTGKVEKTIIEKSTSSIFNEAALNAIKKYKDFTPAIQNKQPVAVWVVIPINFKIR